MFVLAVIEHGSRRIRILGATAHPRALPGWRRPPRTWSWTWTTLDAGYGF
jgi:hypothetical protein